MSYQVLILSLGALLADLMLGTIAPVIPPFFLLVVVFYLAKKLDAFQIVALALLLGLVFELSQLTGSIFTIIFLTLEAIVIRLLTKKIIDLNNKFTQIIFLSIIVLIKILFTWLLNGRVLQSEFLINNIIFLLVSIGAGSLLILIRHAKKTKVL